MEKVKVDLSSPIQAHGEEVSALEFRPPLTRDIKAYGFPFVLNESGDLNFNTKAIAKYIEVLAGIPTPSVDTMVPADFQACMAVILSFFGDARKTLST